MFTAICRRFRHLYLWYSNFCVDVFYTADIAMVVYLKSFTAHT